MVDSKPHDDARSWMSGDYTINGLRLVRAVIHEGLSNLTEMSVMFTSFKQEADLADIVGRTMRVHSMTEDEKERMFTGLCVSAENVGDRGGYGIYVAEVRPWFWLLTRTRDCRVFQEKSAVEIIKQIFSENGFSDYKDQLTDSYDKRVYCVQYRETDYDFICRLMEEEGIYFYFKNDLDSKSVEELILCDSVSAHSPVPGHSSIDFLARHAARRSERSRRNHIYEWSKTERLTTGEMTLNDFDFLSPTTELKVKKAIAKGQHSHNKFEVYDYPGKYRKDTSLGDKRAQVKMEAEAVMHLRYAGAGNVRSQGVGQTFFLEDHPITSNASGFLVSDAKHYVQDPNCFDENDSRFDLPAMKREFPSEMAEEVYACTFGAIPKLEQFRAPLVTPWPEIPGLHTATVVGKSGEEIWTDEHGRIKVQFHWDREGKKDENSSCWVRVVTPWSGTGWGMVALPRMGQEVVIQFEEGDPDRPICTGMLYNEPKKPAFNYPDDATQSGIRTRSSKGGGEKEYHELMFEDKKGDEMMRLQAQKDHQVLIKNKSVETIGLDAHEMVDGEGKIKSDVDDGSVHRTVKKTVTDIIQEGDHILEVNKGDQNFTIEKGSQTFKIDTGDQTFQIAKGDVSVTADLGKITMEATTSIELKVGGSSIKLEPAKITIKSTVLDIKGDAKADLSAPMTNVKASGILVLNGALTKIN